MKLIVGLGNPGRKYEQTRHNVGFLVAQKTAALISASPSRDRFDGEFAEGTSGGQKLLILCPQTFMNASGQSVRKAFDFYKLETQEVLVVCDDLNLDSGRLRLRPKGSAGGQKGLKDIIRHLDSEGFPRLRVGIGQPPDGWSVTDYVLGKFPKSEHDLIETVTTRAAYAAIEWATSGIGSAMNQYNASAEPDSKKKQKQKQTKKDSGNQKATAGETDAASSNPNDLPN